MFTPLTYQLLKLSCIYGFYCCGIPLQWNPITLRVEYIPLNNANIFIRLWSKYSAKLICIIFCIISIYSFHSILNTNGFDLYNLTCIFQIIVFCVTIQSVVFILPVMADIREVKQMINLVVLVSETFEEKMATIETYKQNKVETKHYDNCNVIFALSVGTLVYLPFGIGLMYLTSCKMHFLNVVLPDLTCGTYESVIQSAVYGFQNIDQLQQQTVYIFWQVLRVLGLSILQVWFMSAGFAASCVCLAVLFPGLFYTTEMLNKLGALNTNNPAEYKMLTNLYRCLQIKFKHINSSNLTKIVLPGHLLPVCFIFIIAFNAIVHNIAPTILFCSFLFYCSLVPVHYLYTLALFWRVTAISEDLIFSMQESRATRYEQKYLRTFLPLASRMGTFGILDKDIYTLNGANTIDFTINTLLL